MADPARLAAWFDAHAAGMVLYARQVLARAAAGGGAAGTPAAEDVVQDVFVRLAAEDRPILPDDVRAWLYRAVRNATLDAARSASRRRRRERAAAEVTPPWFDRDPADAVDAAAAEAALAALPAAQREVVVLRIWGGLTLAETAAVTGAAVSTVHDQYKAALARLRERLRIGDPPCDETKTTTTRRDAIRTTP